MQLDGITWRVDGTILGMALLTVADAAAFWSANNPSLMTVRSFTTAGGNKAVNVRKDIMIGGAKAVIETAAVGFGAALVTRSWWPFALPMGYMVLQAGFFRWGLDNPHGSGDIASQAGA